MKNYKYLDKILKTLNEIPARPLDELMLLQAGDKVKSEIPFENLLGQYKYCLDNNIRNSAFYELRKLLVNVCTEEIISSVEEIYNA